VANIKKEQEFFQKYAKHWELLKHIM
jgi:hypothetical protein